MELEQRLTSAHVLTISDSHKPYVVYTDTSTIGLICVLMQNGKVMADASHQLKPHEKNCPIHDLVLTTVIFGLKILRCYLYGARFKVY